MPPILSITSMLSTPCSQRALHTISLYTAPSRSSLSLRQLDSYLRNCSRLRDTSRQYCRVPCDVNYINTVEHVRADKNDRYHQSASLFGWRRDSIDRTFHQPSCSRAVVLLPLEFSRRSRFPIPRTACPDVSSCKTFHLLSTTSNSRSFYPRRSFRYPSVPPFHLCFLFFRAPSPGGRGGWTRFRFAHFSLSPRSFR